MLDELLTELRPLAGNRLRKEDMDEVSRIIREEEPSKPSTRLSTNESLPSLAAVRQVEPARLTRLLRGELDCVVMKCLEKQRDRRYETANALGRDLQRYLLDEPVEARPPSTGYRLGKFLRRNKGAGWRRSSWLGRCCWAPRQRPGRRWSPRGPSARRPRSGTRPTRPGRMKPRPASRPTKPGSGRKSP